MKLNILVTVIKSWIKEVAAGRPYVLENSKKIQHQHSTVRKSQKWFFLTILFQMCGLQIRPTAIRLTIMCGARLKGS